MLTNNEKVSLGNLGDGAVVELFDVELRRVLENIIDPNAKADAVREVALKVKIKPDKEDRTFGYVEVDFSSKLAGPGTFPTKIAIGSDRKGAIAFEYGKRQQKLFPEDEDKSDKVVPIDRENGGEK